MALVTKPYTFTNGVSNLIDAVQVNADLDTLYALVNALLDDANIKPAAGILLNKIADGTLGAKLGVDEGATKRRGKSIITAAESRTNTAYGLLTTPDRVQNIVLPTDGLIVVAYQALWQESVLGAARAAIFLGANQLKVQQQGVTLPATQAAATGATLGASKYAPLTTYPAGLISPTTFNLDHGSDVTTGQALGMVSMNASVTNATVELGGSVQSFSVGDYQIFGGPCFIFAAAGTYDVSVQFKATSGSVTAKERKLWVWTLGF